MRRDFFLRFILIFLLVAILAVGGFFLFRDLEGPTLVMTPDTGKISPATVLKISMEDSSGIRDVRISLKKDGNSRDLFSTSFTEVLPSRTLEVPLKNLSVEEGVFDLELKATDASFAGFGHGNTRTIVREVRLDAQPPKISVRSLPPNIYRGGSAGIRYTVDEEVSQTGIVIAGYFVPAFRQQDNSYLCFYPFPHAMSAQDYKKNIAVTATDLAGNVTTNRIAVIAVERVFQTDRIKVTDSFLQRVQEKMQHYAPGVTDPLQCYLTINSRLRSQNMEALRRLSHKSAAAKLWKGAFQAMGRAALRAHFADHRILLYGNTVIGDAYHLGIDLASLRNAPIPAANDGTVLFIGDMGIYGNLALVDHGLGVLTLYSHMSDFTVKQGDVVKKGDILGHTGFTGLAFGDHLHFGVLVGGIEVSPIEWIDPRWMNNMEKNLAR